MIKIRIGMQNGGLKFRVGTQGSWQMCRSAEPALEVYLQVLLKFDGQALRHLGQVFFPSNASSGFLGGHEDSLGLPSDTGTGSLGSRRV